MITPTKEEIELSLDNLKKEIVLTKKGFANITWAFAFHSNQSKFLLMINASNEKFAETLIIFQERLNNAVAQNADLILLTAQGLDFDSLIDRVFLHYVINTNGTIIQRKDEDYFNVFNAIKRYAKSLHVEVTKDKNESSILQVNNKKFSFPKWGVLWYSSAAYALREIGPIVNTVRYGRGDVIPSLLFGFKAEAKGHTLPNAMTLADFSTLVYMQSNYVESQLKMWGYTSFRWIENEASDTQLFVVEKETHVVVCFRGTSAGKDALTDLNFFKNPAFGNHGAVHRGFQGALDSVWDTLLTILSTLKKGKKIFICGHSLGAALAVLAAFRFELSGYSVANVYVYGCPRVGNKEFVEAYNQRLGKNTFCHINNNDIVTQLPPRFLGFRHVGNIPYVFDKGHTIRHISNALLETEEAEIEFELLDKETQMSLRRNIQKANDSIQASSKFLTTHPSFLEVGTYEIRTPFEINRLSEHSINEYLFKLGCAIVDRKWTEIKLTKDNF